MESLFKLGILLRITDMVSGPCARINKSLNGLAATAISLEPTFEKFKTIGAPLAAVGGILLALLAGTVMSTVETQRALGELSSVGVKDLAALETAGREFSNTWSGTTKAQFIAAAYDIKGGIASLTDAGVAEFAKLAALTGKATKSQTAEMTSLFATAYGIYKDQYSSLTDMQFGEMFSGGIAAAVNIFKSTGSGMAGAIENLGAAATVAKRPLEEQLTVLGMLQATMSGREAGTAYKAFIRDVSAAGEKLGLNFYDSLGNLKGIDQIMGMLRGKFGDLSGQEGAILQKAFTDESYRLVAQMYDKVGALTGNIKQLGDAMGQGTLYTEQMANAMNQDIGAGLAVFAQRTHNLVEALGKQLIPVLAPVFAGLGNIILKLQGFAEKHGTLTRVIMVSVSVIAGLLFVLGGLATAFGVIGLATPAVVSGMGLVTGAFGTAAAAAWSFTGALLANPVTWIVAAVVAAAALIGGAMMWMYRRVEWFKTLMDGFLFFIGFSIGLIAKGWVNLAQWIMAPFSLILSAFGRVIAALPQITGAISDALAGMLNSLPELLSKLFASGQKIVTTLVAGIRSVGPQLVGAVREIFGKVRNLLPFSDAKEGPLSQLTLSGSRIMSTLGEGIMGGAPKLHKTMATALAGAALTTSIAVAPVPSFAATPEAKTAAKGERNARAQGKQVVIKIGNVTLPGVSNASDFVAQLQALVEAHDA